MPRIVETVVYDIEELRESARESARAWYREACLDHDWFDFVFEDFQTICGILGVTLSTSPVKLMGGGTRDKPQLYFRGFWSQGDGASFSGSLCHARGAAKSIRSHAPLDTELHRIADVLQAVQKRNFFGLTADIQQRGNYYHEYTMAIAVERDSPTGQAMTDDAEDSVTEALRDLARWLYRQLQREYEHQTSGVVIDEVIAINDYTFTAEGRRFG